MGEAAVVGVGGDVEQHVTFRRVGVALFDQRLDHGDDFSDVPGGPGLNVRWKNPQRFYVVVVGGAETVRQGLYGLPIGQCLGIDLVIHVGDVGDVNHLGVNRRQ